jgi:carbohydrate diacid regulator
MAHMIRKETAQQIVTSIKSICGCDVNYINEDGIIFASTDEKRLGTFHEIGMQVIRQKQTIEVASDNSFFGTHKGVNLPIVYQNEAIAVIGITGEPDKVRKYAQLARRITLLILREQAMDAKDYDERSQLHYVIRALVFHTKVNQEFLDGILDSYHIPVQTDFRTIILQVDRHNAAEALYSLDGNVTQVFQQIGSKLYCFNYPNEYILLIEEKRFQQWHYLFQQLADENRTYMKISIGSRETLYHQYRSYETAQLALKSLNQSHNIAVYDELDLTLLLASVPGEVRISFLKKVISKLDKNDCTLLSAYFEHDASLKKTCDVLYLHKNTLQYRLDRIWKLTGYNPRSFQDAVILYLGLRLK